ncbi:hypothetical protein PPBDW_I21144 [Photobacterium kishitanii]|nr:hypothetical protein PPBDW_I21144 [Photobacterium kishitanii]
MITKTIDINAKIDSIDIGIPIKIKRIHSHQFIGEENRVNQQR